MKLKVSIIVPVYNGEKTISLCLDSLMNIDFSKDDLEIIVIDNNSTDITKDIIKRYPVKYVYEKKRGRGAARNRGIKESKGEIVAFIDADCMADKRWLREIIKGFDSKAVGACGGNCISFNPRTLIEKYYDFMFLSYQSRGFMSIDLFLPNIPTFNAAYRRNTLEEAGLFDDSFITNEDVDLSWRICLKGWRLNYVPEAIVYRKYPCRLTDFLIKWFERGYTKIYLLEKYTNLIKRPLVTHIDWNKLFFQQLQSLRLIFISLLTGKDIVDKTLPILDIIRDTALFLGRIYGLVMIRLGMKKISLEPNPGRVIWIIMNDEAIILNSIKDCHYILNKIGSRIWALYIENMDISEIVDIIINEYNVDKETAREDIIDFIDKLKKEDLR